MLCIYLSAFTCTCVWCAAGGYVTVFFGKSQFVHKFFFFFCSSSLSFFFNRQKLATMNLTSLALWTSLVSWPSLQIRTKKWRRRFLSSTSPTGQLGSSFECIVYEFYVSPAVLFKKKNFLFIFAQLDITPICTRELPLRSVEQFYSVCHVKVIIIHLRVIEIRPYTSWLETGVI